MQRYRRMWIAGALGALIASGADAQEAKTVAVKAPEVRSVVSELTVSGSAITDLHLRPLFTTTVRLPEPVTSVAVGAPTLFEVEHSPEEPRLVFVKPSTNEAATSNLVIALKSGQEISMRLLSDGNTGATPVDFVVNYQPRQSFLIGSTDAVGTAAVSAQEPPKTIRLIDQALTRQADVASPDWVHVPLKDSKDPKHEKPGNPMLAALGEVRERGEEMLVAYSVMNITDHWIEVLPPQVELSSPNVDSDKKKDKRKPQVLAEQVPIMDYRLNARRLAPGGRADGAVEFARPGFKQSKDRLLLELATASEVDNPILVPVPFVAPRRYDRKSDFRVAAR